MELLEFMIAQEWNIYNSRHYYNICHLCHFVIEQAGVAAML
jgi:hypothetical protein